MPRPKVGAQPPPPPKAKPKASSSHAHARFDDRQDRASLSSRQCAGHQVVREATGRCGRFLFSCAIILEPMDRGRSSRILWNRSTAATRFFTIGASITLPCTSVPTACLQPCQAERRLQRLLSFQIVQKHHDCIQRCMR